MQLLRQQVAHEPVAVVHDHPGGPRREAPYHAGLRLRLHEPQAARLLATWLGGTVMALGDGRTAMVGIAFAVYEPLHSGPVRRAGLSILPPMVVGGLLTVVLSLVGLWQALPGTWLLLYGTVF